MGMPPAGVAVPPAAPAADALPPVPVPDTGEADVEELWGEESESEQTEAEPVEEQQPEVDENGFIDDLAPDEPEKPEEQPATEDEEEPLFEASPYEHNMASDLGLPPAFIKTKVLLPLFFLFIICGGVMGFVVGKMQNRSDGEMPGVVYNAEIPKGRPRCGCPKRTGLCFVFDERSAPGNRSKGIFLYGFRRARGAEIPDRNGKYSLCDDADSAGIYSFAEHSADVTFFQAL